MAKASQCSTTANVALWFRASESRPIKVSQPYKYTITTSHIIGIYSYVCVYYRVVFLPHDATPGNRQYTSCELVANGKQAVAHSFNIKEEPVVYLSSRSTESLESLISPTLPS